MAAPTGSNSTFPDAPASTRHSTRRIFLGPMPEKVVSRAEVAARRYQYTLISHSITDEEADTQQVRHMLKEHTLSSFLSKGGKLEDWGEAEEQNILEEMMQRWRDSEWGAVWRERRRRKAQRTPSEQWVGDTFKIGDVVGVNMLDKSATLEARVINQLNAKPISLQGINESGNDENRRHLETGPSAQPRSVQRDHMSSRVIASSSVEVSSLDRAEAHRREYLSPHSTSLAPIASLSSPALLEALPSLSKGKGEEERQIHHVDGPTQAESGSGDQSELGRGSLERSPTPSTLWSYNVSPVPTPQLPSSNHDELVLRDRMLVRACYSELPPAGKYFDEATHRTTRGLSFLDWGEYLVTWRANRIEIYDDYVMPGKEWVTGHKHLAFIIPLSSPKTHLSLYSFVDLTFCLTCPPTSARVTGSKSRWIFQREEKGVNIFIFKLKCRSRAYDWLWLLWRYKGGQLPEIIEVRNPRLDSRVKIDVPRNGASNMEEVFKVFSRDNIIALCIDSLRTVGHWNSIIERQIRAGETLELAWRMDTNLDWIWLEDDVEGNVRKWAVLCGLALQQPTVPVYLEIRLVEHQPTHVYLKHGERIDEPPGIEGYVVRVRANASEARQQEYLATHDGFLFILSPARAHPPTPPGIMTFDNDAKRLRKSEVIRGSLQIMEATSVCDFQNIILIRRAFQLTPVNRHTEQGSYRPQEVFAEQEATPSDDEDAEGEDHLAKSSDKPKLRMKRAFELLLRNGRVIRFEVHSCRGALQWLQRLQDLILYWKERRQGNAREEMDLADTRRPRITPYTHACKSDHQLLPEPPVDASAPLPGLTSLFNWCVLDGCKPIIRGGKVYMRRRFRGPYKPIQLFLVPGYLVHYHINSKSALHRLGQTTNLVDAYVYSGYLAALTLPGGEYDPNRDPAPRRYPDGLESNDADEDTLCTIWYNPMAPGIQDGPQSSAKAVPALSYKRKRLVIRTRSRLERDAWCWALNQEIERLAREQKAWEERVRMNGALVELE